MTARPRPNLGGLFDGSTPADRPSSIVGRLGPKPVASVASVASVAPVADERDDAAAGPLAAKFVPASQAGHRTEAAGGSTGQTSPLGTFEWFDPVKAMELYFGFLQSALDAHREFAVGWAKATGSLPRYAGRPSAINR